MKKQTKVTFSLGGHILAGHNKAQCTKQLLGFQAGHICLGFLINQIGSKNSLVTRPLSMNGMQRVTSVTPHF